jgi:hypothetical protein
VLSLACGLLWAMGCSTSSTPAGAGGAGGGGAGGGADGGPDSGPSDGSSCAITAHTLTNGVTADGGGAGGDPCVFTTDDVAPNPFNVRVMDNGVTVPQGGGSGWDYGDDTQTIVVTGSYCDAARAGTLTMLTMLFGCLSGEPIP